MRLLTASFHTITDAMLAKLRLALSTDKLDPNMPLVDLGVDSLVAVLLRNWSIQETGVDVPVLKTLGGDSTLEIAQFIVENLGINTDEALADTLSISASDTGFNSDSASSSTRSPASELTSVSSNSK